MTELSLKRRKIIGQLLKDPALSFAEIARRVSVSPPLVAYLQRKYFPTAPTRPANGNGNRGDANGRRAEVGRLLREGMSVMQVAEQVGLSRARVDQIRRKYFPETKINRLARAPDPGPIANYHDPVQFYRTLRWTLLRCGAKYCARCRLLKDLGEYSPASALHISQYCRACNTAKQIEYYRDHPQHREYVGAWRRAYGKKKHVLKVTGLLEREAPELARQVRDGTLSLEDALNQIRKPSPNLATVPVVPTVDGFLSGITAFLKPEEIAELRRRL